MRLLPAVVAALLLVGCWSPFYVTPDGKTSLLTGQEKVSKALEAAFKNPGLFAPLSGKKVYIEVTTLADKELPGPAAQFVKSYIKKLILKEAPDCAVLSERGGEDTTVVALVRAFGVEASPLLLGPLTLLFHMVRYRAACEVTIYAYDRAGNYKIEPTTLSSGNITWSKFLILGFGPF